MPNFRSKDYVWMKRMNNSFKLELESQKRI